MSNRIQPCQGIRFTPTTLAKWLSPLVLVLGVVCTGEGTVAQIVPDETLGNERSRLAPEADVGGLPADLIEGGAERGANLFHSFEQFNVGDEQRVYFANPAGIENILGRVTGGDVSDILGTLGVDGAASLFLLNPNGIVFGENARLDVAGSFVASTADSFLFGDGLEFSAANPEAPPLLTINVTPGLQYGTQQQGRIENAGTLEVGQDFTLSAGNLDLRGQLWAGGDLTLLAGDTVRVRDSAEHPFIAAAKGQLLVQGNESVDIFALNHASSGLFSGGDMVLRSAEPVGGDAHYWSGGSFRIEKLDGSLGDLFSPYDPIIRSLGDVSLDVYQGTSLHILAGGEVNIGTVIITGAETGAAGVDYIQETIQLSDGTEIDIDGSVQPTLDIRAGVEPVFIGVPGVTGFNPATDIFLGQVFLTDAPTSADITIGDVSIVPPNGLVFITNQYQPNTALSGGDISVTGAGVLGFGIDAIGLGGNGSSVILDSRGDIAITDSRINSSSDAGNSGDIILLANESVSLKNSFVFSQISGAGEGGDINLKAGQLLVIDGALLAVNTTSEGKGGNLIINAAQAVQLRGTFANNGFSSILAAQTDGIGDGGNLEITTPLLLVTDGALVSTSTLGEGKGGNLIVNASQTVQLIGASADGQPSSLGAQTEGTGDAGNVEITTPQLLIQDGAGVSATTFDEGNAGNLIVNAEGVQLIGTSADGQFSSGLSAQTEGTGDGGNVNITTTQLLISDGARMSAGTLDEGNGGSLIVKAEEVQLIGTSADGEFSSGLFAQTVGKGDGGNVEIFAPWLLVMDGAEVSASAFNKGKGGNLIVNASETVQLIGTSADGEFVSGLFAQASGTGDGGNVDITTTQLLVQDGAGVSATTFDEGNAGNLIVNASSVQLIGRSADGEFGSGLLAQTEGKGDGGNLEITTTQLLVTDGARVSANTLDEGDAGSLIVRASDVVQLVGRSADGQFSSSLSAQTEGTGDGGNVDITTTQLLVRDGARVSADTLGEGNAGSLIVNASEFVQLIGTSANGQFLSGLFAQTIGKRDGGNVEISTPWLLVTDGALISAATYGKGNGGSLIVNVSEEVQLSGTGGLSVEATAGGTAGDLIVRTNTMSVSDGAQVTVSSPSGQAGNLSISAEKLFLNQGTLFAETGISSTEDGANITLQNLVLLFLENESLISATALADANGGNVNINADFIVAKSPEGPEGSDIIANAFQGNGGRVSVTSNGLFGIEFRPQRTPLNDITVSSQFGLAGEFIENTPGIDPSQGLVELPSNLVDPESLIDRSCSPGGAALQSSFIITGRGGIPTSPTDPLSSNSIVSEWVTLDSEAENSDDTETDTKPTSTAPQPIVEAQGWMVNERGQVVLVADASTVAPQAPRQTSPSCEDIRATN